MRYHIVADIPQNGKESAPVYGTLAGCQVQVVALIVVGDVVVKSLAAEPGNGMMAAGKISMPSAKPPQCWEQDLALHRGQVEPRTGSQSSVEVGAPGRTQDRGKDNAYQTGWL